MSYHAQDAIAELKVGNMTAKFVLMIVARYANGERVCWPSIDRLASDTESSRRTVCRSLSYLEKAGFLKRTKRYGKPDVLQLTDRVPINQNPVHQNGQIVQIGIENGQIGTPKSDRLSKEMDRLAHKPITEPIKERTPYSPPQGDIAHQEDVELEKRKNIADGYPADFERLWQRFPRNPNSSKQLAYKRWRKLSQSDREDCEDTTPLYQAELDKLKPGKDGRKPVMHLSTYISQAMWENYINGQVQENPGLFGNGAGRHHSH